MYKQHRKAAGYYFQVTLMRCFVFMLTTSAFIELFLLRIKCVKTIRTTLKQWQIIMIIRIALPLT